MIKYIILLMLFIVGCSDSNPKFHYGDKVKVSSGFFSCDEGIVISEVAYCNLYYCDYTYKLDHLKDEVGSNVSIEVEEKNLSIMTAASLCGGK